MNAFLTAIVDDDLGRVGELSRRLTLSLATRRIDEARLFESKIVHWIYAGDTALHLAAAGYRVELSAIVAGGWSRPELGNESSS